LGNRLVLKNKIMDSVLGLSSILFGLILIFSILSHLESTKYFIEESNWRYAALFLSLFGFIVFTSHFILNFFI